MPDNTLELLIRAVDEASGTLAKVHGELKRTVESSGEGLEKYRRTADLSGREVAQLSRQLRVMAGDLAGQVDPALGRVIGSVSMATSGFRGFSAGAVLAAGGLAALVAGAAQYLNVAQETVRTQAALNFAMRGLDVQGVRSQMREAAQAVEAFNVAGERTATMVVAGLQQALAKIGLAVDPFEALRRARQSLEELLPFERREDALKGTLALVEAERQLLAVRGAQAQRLADAEGYLKVYRDQATALEREATAMRSLINLEAERDLADLKRRQGSPTERENIEARRRNRLAALEGQTSARYRAIGEAYETGAQGIQERTYTPLPPTTNPYAEEEEGMRVGKEAVRQIRGERAGIENARTQAAREMAGLTAAQRAQLDLQAIEAERLLKIELARGEVQKEALANEEAQSRAQAVRLQELERSDPAAGMAKAARELSDEWAAAGRVMESVTLQTAGTMRGMLTDVFSGEKIGKDFWRSFVRIGADALSQWTIGSLFKLLPGGAGAGYPFGSLADAALTMPAALAGGGGGGAVVQGTAPYGARVGRGYVDPVTGQLVGPSTMVPGDPQYAAAAASYQPDLFGYGAYGVNAAATGLSSGSFWNTPMYATQGPSGGYIAGPTYGQTAGYAASAAGAALAAYGLYQGTSQAQNTSYLAGVGTGAVTGALYGAAIGGVYGAAIGAVAGALIGFFGANASQAKYKKQHRRQQRTRDAARLAQGIAAALAEADQVPIQELLERHLPSGNTVGGLLLALARHLGHQELEGYLVDYGAATEVFSYERLGSIGEWIAYLGPGVQPLLDAALAVFRREAELERRVLIGQEEVITRGGLRATVQTITPLSARANLQAGRDTFFLQQPGQSDAELERFLFRLAALDDDRDLRVFHRDDEGLVFSRTLRA